MGHHPSARNTRALRNEVVRFPNALGRFRDSGLDYHGAVLQLALRKAQENCTQSASLRYVHAGEAMDIWPPLFLRHYSKTKECLGSSAERPSCQLLSPLQELHDLKLLAGGASRWAGVTARAALNPPALSGPASRCRTLLRLLRCSEQLLGLCCVEVLFEAMIPEFL